MKTISMSYGEYEDEKSEFINLGIFRVARWLESEKTLEEFLGESIKSYSVWGRILKALEGTKFK